MKRFAFLALLLPLLSHAAIPSEEEILKTRTASCREFLSKLPAEYFHGWVESPEDIRDSSSKKILVFYYGKKAPDFVNPIVFYNGGPGYPDHGWKTFERETSVRGNSDKYSFIYIDQRGTGCSDHYPKGRTAEAALRARWYGSSGIVFDSEIVRKKLLDDKKWKVFGQSYGAFIVHRYVVNYPDSVEKAYAHANAISADASQRLAERIASQHRVLGIYLSKYPEDKVRLRALQDFAESNKCIELNPDEKMCGYATTEFISSLLGFTIDWPSLHEDLTTVTLGDSVDIAKFTKYLQEQNREEEAEEDLIPVTSDRAIAIFDRNTAGYSEESCYKASALALGDPNIDWPVFDECQSFIQSHRSNEGRHEVETWLGSERDWMTYETVRKGLERLGTGKFFLYSGENDSFVPKATIAPEAAAMGDLLFYTNFPKSGHDGYFTEEKVWSDLLL